MFGYNRFEPVVTGGYRESGEQAVTEMLREEPKTNSRNLDKNLAKGDDLVAGFISGATFGALAGGAFTAGSGIVPGAVFGGLVGAVAPQAIHSLGRTHNGHKS